MILGSHVESGKFPSNLMAVSKHSQEGANVVEEGHIREALFPSLSQGGLAGAEDPFQKQHAPDSEKQGQGQTTEDLETY